MDEGQKFAVVSVVNGIFNVDSEWGNNLDGARIAFHNRCAALWNEKDVEKAIVRLVNSDFLTYTNYFEGIEHLPEPEDDEAEPA